MNRIRSGAGISRQQPLIGAPDRSLTANAGMAAISELCDRLGVIEALDAAVGQGSGLRFRQQRGGKGSVL